MIRIGLGVVGLLAIPAVMPAQACSPAKVSLSPAEVREHAREQFDDAAVVIDAEVIEPMVSYSEEGMIPAATLRVERSLKGSLKQGDFLAVLYVSSCDLKLTHKGEHVRILLTGRAPYFTAGRFHNFPPWTDNPDDLPIFSAEIDRLSGMPRPEGYSIFPLGLDPAAELAPEQEN